MYFSQDDINTIIQDAHAYISRYGISIIDQLTCYGSSNLEGFFYRYIDLLYAVEDGLEFDYEDLDYQKLVQRLYSLTTLPINDEVNLSYVFIYGDVITFTLGEGGVIPFIRLTDTPQDYVGDGNKVVIVNNSENGLIFSDLKSYYTTTTGTPKTITWLTDIVPNDTRTYLQKHGLLPQITEENKGDNGSWTQNAAASYNWNSTRTTLVLTPQTESTNFIIL